MTANRTAGTVVRRRMTAADRRAQIVETAQGLYRTAGRDSVSMEGIAAAAGINVALLYRHFRSSTDVYREAVLDPLRELLDTAVAADRRDWPAEPGERLVAVHTAVLEVLRSAGPLLGIALFSDGDAGTRFYRERILPLIDRWIEPMVQEVADRGSLKQDSRTIAVEIFGIDLTRVMSPDGPGDDFDVRRTARRIAALQWPGLKGARRS